ncbi:DUF2975 domain-containing protein [Clostridium tyrobutyricum]|uniref:DUF2975 domain-containing protein n=2 Tax=Clostridium tyrobutyricum TaxID=1519 RepID=UPI00073DAAF0|nr:DUF2975 domain-containing protein [Clostridium tyrobutyricum]MBR9648881.1 DUF2975 domain-containing protein [Clostridium tyrobutyricum]MBV4428691.1 DUF2975 domain-containing protein [Clostridium tyrobutyricum]MBV4443832.1 DUF2975 domain-containing protein [Clostridium tyrobutyricum]
MNTKLNVFLKIIYYMGISGLIGSIIGYFTFPNIFSDKPLIPMLIFSIVAYCCALAICHELIKINSTLICKTPFTTENIKRMQKISAYLFIISAYVFTKDWLKFKSHIFTYNFNKDGLITDSECLIFILLGLFVLILANIFKTAVKIKNENDLTI